MLIWPYQVQMVQTLLQIKNRLTKLSTLPYPITQSWEFTIPIPHWILRFFHIEGGLLIIFQITISTHWEVDKFNSFTIGIIFRQRTERSLPPHPIKEGRIVFGYLWPNPYYQICGRRFNFTEFRFGIGVELDASDVALGDYVVYGRMHNVTKFLVHFADCPLHRCHIGIINNGGIFCWEYMV